MRIKKLRKAKKMTQKDLANRFGVTNITVSRWETGIKKPSIETAIKLADFFGVSLDELLRD